MIKHTLKDGQQVSSKGDEPVVYDDSIGIDDSKIEKRYEIRKVSGSNVDHSDTQQIVDGANDYEEVKNYLDETKMRFDQEKSGMMKGLKDVLRQNLQRKENYYQN